jgi:polyhydroxyalkanoate synthesis regulator phasin/DNA-directed RNA polymerase subunit RPC12/RpoP
MWSAMTKPSKRTNRLIAGYKRMMEVIRATADEADKEVRPKLTYLIEAAKDRLVDLGELTREEAEKVGDYLRRDVEHAAAFFAKGKTRDKTEDKRSEFVDWLRLDTNLIERDLFDLFLSVADKTELEWLALEQQGRPRHDYKTGEITGMGTLRCISCGHLISFHSTGQIPRCPRCHGTVFSRA